MGIVGSVVGGLISSRASKSASRSIENSANEDRAFQVETRDMIFERNDPFYEPGIIANNALAFELGLGERPIIGATSPEVVAFQEANPNYATEANRIGDILQRDESANGAWLRQQQQNVPQYLDRFRVGEQVFDDRAAAEAYAAENTTGGTPYQGFQATPGYQFQVDQGVSAIDSSAAARGGLYSGATLQSQNAFGQGLANQEYGNYLNRLTGMAGSGQAAAGMNATAATNAATGVSNALGSIGNAQAAGAIGQANAFNSTLGNINSIFANSQARSGGQNPMSQREMFLGF